MLEGTVVASFQDFIRSTIIVRHALQRQGRVHYCGYLLAEVLSLLGVSLVAGYLSLPRLSRP